VSDFNIDVYTRGKTFIGGLLNQSFGEWKSSLEQIDDVVVVGIKI